AVWRTTDAGLSWSPWLTNIRDFTFIAPSPDYADDHALFAYGYSEPFMVTTDGGSSWEQISAPIEGTGSIYEMKPSPTFADDHTFFAATERGIWSVIVPEPLGTPFLLGAICLATFSRRRRLLSSVPRPSKRMAYAAIAPRRFWE